MFGVIKDTGVDADVFQVVDDSSAGDKEAYPAVRQTVDSIAPVQRAAQRSPVCRHESPSKPSATYFQSPPHQQPSALGIRGATDTHLSEWGVSLVCDFHINVLLFSNRFTCTFKAMKFMQFDGVIIRLTVTWIY